MNGKLTTDGIKQLGVPKVRYDELQIDIDGKRAVLMHEGFAVYEWLLPTVTPGAGDVIRIKIVGELPVVITP